MKLKKLLLITVMLIMAMTSLGQTVYVAGDVKNENNKRVAKVWKNGEELYSLTNGTQSANSNSIYVAGNDVYVAGYEINANSKWVAKIWKNDKELYVLSDGTTEAQANSIYVAGNDVFVAGYVNQTGKGTAKVWKNGELLYNLTAGQWGYDNASGICVAGNDVYVCGREYGISYSNAKVWKNGQQWWTTNISGYNATARDICVSSTGNVYFSGNTTSSTATIWENQGSPVAEYESTGRINPYAYAYSIAVSGNDVYAAVTSSKDRIYKNDEPLYEFSSDISVGDMYLLGNDIYVTGSQGSDLKVWKNGEELYTLNEGSGSANSIFVVPSGTGIAEIETTNITVYFSNHTLYIDSAAQETVSVYSLLGKLLYSTQKGNGKAHVDLGNIQEQVLIVKGGSGWAKKIIQ